MPESCTYDTPHDARCAAPSTALGHRPSLRALIESERRDLENHGHNATLRPIRLPISCNMTLSTAAWPARCSAAEAPASAADHPVPQSAPRRASTARACGRNVSLSDRGAKSEQELKRAISGGAARVLVSAPVPGARRTIVYGLNQDQLKDSDTIISCASCTTNCLAPLAAILHRACGIERAFACAIHAYTADQRLVDAHHSDLQRARAAGLSIIPTSRPGAPRVRCCRTKGRITEGAARVCRFQCPPGELNARQERHTRCALNASLPRRPHGAWREFLVYRLRRRLG